MDGAAAAQTGTAAEFGAGQADRVAQHPQEWSVGLDIDVVILAIDRESQHPPCLPGVGANSDTQQQPSSADAKRTARRRFVQQNSSISSPVMSGSRSGCHSIKQKSSASTRYVPR